MIYELVLIVALIAIVTGVALLSFPAGLIAAGIVAAGYVLLRERSE